jgi:hypothetical protein
MDTYSGIVVVRNDIKKIKIKQTKGTNANHWDYLLKHLKLIIFICSKLHKYNLIIFAFIIISTVIINACKIYYDFTEKDGIILNQPEK